MKGWHSLRIVLLMLLLGVTSVSAYLFAVHQLYFCLLFSVLIIVGIVVAVVYSHNQATRANADNGKPNWWKTSML